MRSAKQLIALKSNLLTENDPQYYRLNQPKITAGYQEAIKLLTAALSRLLLIDSLGNSVDQENITRFSGQVNNVIKSIKQVIR